MKKLMTLALGAALAITTVAVTFGQDAPPKKEKKDSTKKGKKKDTTKGGL